MRNLEKDEIEMTAKREAMIEQGFRLFAEKGIEPVGMLEVAEACHLGIATIYRSPLFLLYAWFGCLAMIGGFAKYFDHETPFTKWICTGLWTLFRDLENAVLQMGGTWDK